MPVRPGPVRPVPVRPVPVSRAARRPGSASVPWYSTDSSDFNYDYQVTLDESRGQTEYNYRPEPGLLGGDRSSEMPGHSCFLREGAAETRPSPAEAFRQPKFKNTRAGFT